jgi:hypothetical protein
MIRILEDFNQLDTKLRVILTDANDVKSERIELGEGMHAIIWDGDIEAEGVLEFEDER